MQLRVGTVGGLGTVGRCYHDSGMLTHYSTRLTCCAYLTDVPGGVRGQLMAGWAYAVHSVWGTCCHSCRNILSAEVMISWHAHGFLQLTALAIQHGPGTMSSACVQHKLQHAPLLAYCERLDSCPLLTVYPPAPS